MDAISKDILEFLNTHSGVKLGEIRQHFPDLGNCPELVQGLKDNNLIDYTGPLTYLCTISINKYGISALNSLKNVKEVSELEKENIKLADENLKYSQLIREQEKRIKELEESNKMLQGKVSK